MIMMRKAVFPIVLAIAVGMGIYKARQASQLHNQLVALEQQQASWNDQLQSLQHERDDATNRLASLLEEVEGTRSHASELLKLRGEVSRLRNEMQDVLQSNSVAPQTKIDRMEFSTNGTIGRAVSLKRMLDQRPDKKIPDIQYLGDDRWLNLARMPMKLDTEEDLRRGMSIIRQEAKQTFARVLGKALALYAQENGGTLPTDVLQLKPYLRPEPDPEYMRWTSGPSSQRRPQNFDPPVDDSVLLRYRIMQTGTVSDLQPNQAILAEKAPVDDQFDTLFQIGLTNFIMQGTGGNRAHGTGSWGPLIHMTRPTQQLE